MRWVGLGWISSLAWYLAGYWILKSSSWLSSIDGYSALLYWSYPAKPDIRPNHSGKMLFYLETNTELPSLAVSLLVLWRITCAFFLFFPIKISFRQNIINCSCNVFLYLQRTVYNNLKPDHIVDPKALDYNYCKPPTLWLHNLCLQVLTASFIGPRHSP